MSNAIGPGDWVECVRAEDPDGRYLGKVFRCLKVVPSQDCELNHGPCAGLTIEGMPITLHGWAMCCFRPIYRPKASLIERLKQPVKVKA